MTVDCVQLSQLLIKGKNISILIKLQFTDLSADKPLVASYDPGLHDVRLLLIDVCRSLERQGHFVVSGFGEEYWPVEVGTDLPVFLEQLPGAIRAISSHKSVEIDFYEQGIERAIWFSPEGDEYIASCTSLTNWCPCPVTERIGYIELQEMLAEVRDEFVKAVRVVAPELLLHPWLRAWIEESQTSLAP